MLFFPWLFGQRKEETPAVEKWRIDWRRDELSRNLTAAMWRHNTWVVASMLLNHNLSELGKADLTLRIAKAQAELDEAKRLSEDFKNLHG